jgi:hypothetical protein
LIDRTRKSKPTNYSVLTECKILEY